MKLIKGTYVFHSVDPTTIKVYLANGFIEAKEDTAAAKPEKAEKAEREKK
jgi:hypothetical protein